LNVKSLDATLLLLTTVDSVWKAE